MLLFYIYDAYYSKLSYRRKQKPGQLYRCFRFIGAFKKCYYVKYKENSRMEASVSCKKKKKEEERKKIRFFTRNNIIPLLKHNGQNTCLLHTIHR